MAGLIAAGIAALAVGSSSLTWFVGLSVVVLIGTAYAAFFWPRATLVGVATTTLLDPGVAVRLLPDVLANGPIGISEPLLAVAGVVALTRVGRAGAVAVVKDPTFALMALFVVVSVLSALANRTPPHVAAFGIVMTVDAMAVFFVWLALQPPPGVGSRAIGSIVAAGAVIGLFGIAQVLLTPSLFGFDRFALLPGDVGRITSFLGNPNLLASVFGFMLPFPLYALVRLPDRRRQVLAGAVALILLVALALTFSRGSWIAAAAGIGIGALLFEWRVLVVGPALAAVALAVVVVIPSHLVGIDRVAEAPASSVGSDGSWAELARTPEASPPPDPLRGRTSEEIRLMFLRDGLRIVRDNPLLGVGPGRYGGAVATIFPSPVYDEYGTTLGRFRTVHNFWLHIAGEVGVIGVALFLTMVAALIIRLARTARRADGDRFVVLAGAATAAIVVSINNVTEMVFEGNIPAVLVWLILGAGAALAPNPRLGLLRGAWGNAA